jgi:hypothetical protein
MANYIKYKRSTKKFDLGYNQEDIQAFLDSLIVEGWRIITYEEKPNNDNDGFTMYLLCGKEKTEWGKDKQVL